MPRAPTAAGDESPVAGELLVPFCDIAVKHRTTGRFAGSGSWWWPAGVLRIWWRRVTSWSVLTLRDRAPRTARPVCEKEQGPKFIFYGTARSTRSARCPLDRSRMTGGDPHRCDRHPPGTAVRGGGQEPFRGPSWACPAAPWPARPAGSVPLVPRHRTWVIVRGLGASPVAPWWPSGAWRARGPRRGVHSPTTRRAATGSRRRPVRRVTEPVPARVSAGAPGNRSSRATGVTGTGGCTTGRTTTVVAPPAGRAGVVTSG
jgi:hypothetical protein